MNTPARIQNFDRLETVEAKRQTVEDDIDMIFGSCDGQDIDCLTAAIDNATSDLKELSRDCEASAGHAAREDVLAFQLNM